MARLAVGIDLGGTNIKLGLVTEEGAIHGAPRTTPTEADRGPAHVVKNMVVAIEGLLAAHGMSRQDLTAIGVGSPGPMSSSRGMIYRMANLPGWNNTPLRDMIHQSTGLPTVLCNDANAAAYGEFRRGAGGGADDMVMLTLGTGIGGGVIAGGRLLQGHFENAAELGHTIVVPGGRPCGCGQQGCLEAYSSAGNVAKRLVEALGAGGECTLRGAWLAGRPIDAVDVVQAVRAEDPLATRIWEEACYYLAIGCVNIQHTFNPRRIVLAGGMIAAGELLFEPVRRCFGELTWNLAEDQPEIVPAALGNDAGVIGAAGLAFQAQTR